MHIAQNTLMTSYVTIINWRGLPCYSAPNVLMQLNIELHMYVLILSMTITHVHTEPFIAIGLYIVYTLSQLLYNTAPHAHSHINSAIIKSN